MIVNEDLMDLGPFLQHYVLRNPFSQTLFESQRIQPAACRNISKLTPFKRRLGYLHHRENRNCPTLKHDLQNMKLAPLSDSELVLALNSKYDLLDLTGSKSDTTQSFDIPLQASAQSLLDCIKTEPGMMMEEFHLKKDEQCKPPAVESKMDICEHAVKSECEINISNGSTESVNPSCKDAAETACNTIKQQVKIVMQRRPAAGRTRFPANSRLRASYLRSKIAITNARNSKLQRQMKSQNLKFLSLLEEFAHLQEHFNYLTTLFRRFSGNFLS